MSEKVLSQLFAESADWYSNFVSKNAWVPKMVTSVSVDQKRFTFLVGVLDKLKLDHMQRQKFIKVVLEHEEAEAYVYGTLVMTHPNPEERLDLVAANSLRYVMGSWRLDRGSDGRVKGIHHVSTYEGQDPEAYPGAWFLTSVLSVSDIERRTYIDIWEEIREYIQINSLPTSTSQTNQFEDGFRAYTQRDHSRALKLLQPLAKQGHAAAQFYFGNMYASGNGVQKDIKEAMRWFRKSAEQGYAMAQWFLGSAYLNGEGVQKDAGEAARWFRKAAKQGISEAQYFLGDMYANGEGVQKDAKEAARWYRKAAKQGHLAAQLNLGDMYANGEGVLQSSSAAVDWYYKAGMGFLKAGKRATAQTAYDRINEIGPGHFLGKKLHEALYP